DEGVLLSVRRHGETSAIIELITEHHGRHAGLVRGGASSKMTPVLQPGAQLAVDWQARIADHLGTFSVDQLRSRAAHLMGGRRRLAAFNAMSALLLAFLPEREPQNGLYNLTSSMADALAEDAGDWPALYVVWELGLLGALGFPLDLSRCAATGVTEDLIWVSPKSGRAVSASGGRGWEERLLGLPGFLRGSDREQGDVQTGLSLTGHFLESWALPTTSLRGLPAARARLCSLLTERSTEA
ncbi:MAG: DNA repair protein RecO, partial [Pseudomonadota bacterium]